MRSHLAPPPAATQNRIMRPHSYDNSDARRSIHVEVLADTGMEHSVRAAIGLADTLRRTSLISDQRSAISDQRS